MGTNINIIVQGLEITSKTEDCAISVGDDLELMVGTTQTPDSYLWEARANETESWDTVATTATYWIRNAQMNTPVWTAYQYRITVTSASGTTDSEIISVLVSDNYKYRTISLRNGDTDVSAYMHDETRLVISSLAHNSADAATLETAITDGCIPLILYDVSLVNQNNQVLPYFGFLQVDFHVDNTYEGKTLKVYHLIGRSIVTYSSIVTGGVLSVMVDALSPFMIEVPAESTHIVTASAGGSVAPLGTINIAKGADKTFTFLPNEGLP